MRSNDFERLFLPALLLTATLSAQNIVFHDDPTVGNGGTIHFPFGSEGVRTQQLVPNSVLGMTPATINDLYVDPYLVVSQVHPESQVYYGDFEVRMGTTQLTTLTATWDTNLPNPTTVYRGPLLVNFVRGQWTPLGLPGSFQWAPTSTADNLVIDFICWDVIDTGAITPTVAGYFLNVHRSPTNSFSRAYRHNWATVGQPTTAAGVDGMGVKLGLLLDSGNFVVHNGSCPGSSGLTPRIGATPGTWPVAGSPFDVALSDGPASSFATLVIGLETANYLGVPLPFDMAALGAPGCMFWHGWQLFLPITAIDTNGNATVTVPLSASIPAGAQLYATWLCLDPTANSFGMLPSGHLTMAF